MKRLFLVFLLGLVVIGAARTNLNADDLNFGINVGTVTDDKFSFSPFIWTLGAELNFNFGKMFTFAPEISLWQDGFKFKTFWLFPGAILNVNFSNFFVGGGVVKGFLIGDDVNVSTDFALKLNAGLRGGGFKLTAFVITAFDSFFKDGFLVGASLGFML